MRLYRTVRAPNPRRVMMFMAEKGIDDIELVDVDLAHGQQSAPDYLARNPFARVPALELDDGRTLTESRAICIWLEGRYPEPNLIGRDAAERAFIEAADRELELYFFMPWAMRIRHGHPGFANLEPVQIAAWAKLSEDHGRKAAEIFDRRLARQPFMAGERFSIADITGYCAYEFARGLAKFSAREAGLIHLADWHARIGARPAAQAQ